MSSLATTNVQEFHARLFSREGGSPLFAALRKLAHLNDPRLLEGEEMPFEGWPSWYSSAAETTALAPTLQPA